MKIESAKASFTPVTAAFTFHSQKELDFFEGLFGSAKVMDTFREFTETTHENTPHFYQDMRDLGARSGNFSTVVELLKKNLR